MIRQPIAIYGKTTVQDDAGGFSITDSLLLATLAAVKPFNRSYDNEIKQAVMQEGIKCEIWKRLDFSPTHHHTVEWKGNKYQIQTVTLGIAPSKVDSFTAIRIRNG